MQLDYWTNKAQIPTEGVDVVDPLLPALGGDLRLVRPVVELHLRDPGDLADLPEVELDLVEMLCQIDGFEKIDLPAACHCALAASLTPPAGYKAPPLLLEGCAAVTQRSLTARRAR